MSDKIFSNENGDAIRCEIVSIITDKINSIMGAENWLNSHSFTTEEVKNIINDTFKFFNGSLYEELNKDDEIPKNVSVDYTKWAFTNTNTIYWVLTIIRSHLNDKTDRVMTFKLIQYILNNINYVPERYLDMIKDEKNGITVRAAIMVILQHIRVDKSTQPE